MNSFTWVGVLCVSLSACTSTSSIPKPLYAALPAQQPQPAIEHGERPASRPFRIRRSAPLPEGRFYSQARLQAGADQNALQASLDYGFSDSVMLGVAVSNGHDATTISLAEDPGRLIDFGAQWCFYQEKGGPRLATRLDVVLSDETSFEPGGGVGIPSGRDSSSKVSYQPSLLASFPVGSDGVSIYSSAGIRLGDRTEPTIALGAGLRVPLVFADFVTEIDWARQSLDGGRINEAYLTPGLEWTAREKLFLAVGASIGLTRTSEDWMASFTMGVRF